MFGDMLNGLSGNNMYFLQGKAKNPMMEQMLKGVDFRTFAFTYIFVPKSLKKQRWSIKSYMDLEVQCCLTLMHLWVVVI